MKKRSDWHWRRVGRGGVSGNTAPEAQDGLDAMIDIPALLQDVSTFISTVHVVEEDLLLEPRRDHRASCIDYQDVEEMADRFVEELIDTVVPWCYSDQATQKLLDRLKPAEATNAVDAERRAWARVTRKAKRLFRTGNLRGQFSELILANFLQHYFHAAPLIRKMPLTTNPTVERHGADAIHVARHGDSYRLYLGEAKTYSGTGHGFRRALKDAIDDAVNLHRPRVWREIETVSFQDGVPEELEEVGNRWMDGELRDVEVHVVCIATYQRNEAISGRDRQECVDQVMAQVRGEITTIRKDALVSNVPSNLLPRLSYIIFSVADLEYLIAAFDRELGTA